ncbi:MAG: GNAT family N-acetyltransferase [Betaproteobacteria bacterium]|nr:GNAT family N-acetyltransferase [Betaproteobacteria bacterium]
MTEFSTRPLLASDQQILWDIFHIALWDPPPARLRPRSVLVLPEVRIYAEHWGRDGDIGVAGEIPGRKAPIGAAWMRLITGGQGLAYIDDSTPQLGIALFPAYQRQGLGERMLRAALDAAKHRYQRVSLSVHPENPAIALYRRCGFVQVDVRKSYPVMTCELRQALRPSY